MAVRDFLLPLVSYPLPLSGGAIERVVRLVEGLSRPAGTAAARRDIPTRLSAAVCEIEIEPGLYFEGADIGDFLAAETRKSNANAEQLARVFEEIATRHDIRHRCRLERRTAYDTGLQLIEEARLHHATVLPMRRDDVGQQDLMVQLLFNSGRPALICPDNPGRQPATSFQTIAIAWDASRSATRAVADAMPFLRRAGAVRIFTATDDKPNASSGRGSELVEHLTLQGVETVVFEQIKKTDAHSIGSFMEAYVAAHHVDLLVMGAYGHSRLREFILGGATRSILANPPGWVLLSH
jgi:nucleotide-binding universal stress UspA family protein